MNLVIRACCDVSLVFYLLCKRCVSGCIFCQSLYWLSLLSGALCHNSLSGYCLTVIGISLIVVGFLCFASKDLLSRIVICLGSYMSELGCWLKKSYFFVLFLYVVVYMALLQVMWVIFCIV
ncbi:hypothetical protein HanPI659440_Chr13g0517561 [Helianthus annuus]|nr:hypothetical protein HanPI659440_Chr13g0517561 [Helianthus annuus]